MLFVKPIVIQEYLMMTKRAQVQSESIQTTQEETKNMYDFEAVKSVPAKISPSN